MSKLEQIARIAINAAMDMIEEHNTDGLALATSILSVIHDEDDLSVIASTLLTTYVMSKADDVNSLRKTLSESEFIDPDFREELLLKSDEELEEFVKELKK